MPSLAQVERDYYKSLLPNTKSTALADLKAEFFQGLSAGTVASVAPATTTVNGTVKKAAAVADQAALTVTDIATAQTAVNALVSKINALLAASRTAGQLT